MKQKTTNFSMKLKTGLTLAFALGFINYCEAQSNGIESAANQFSTTAGNVQKNVSKGLIALAIVCAGVGLVGVLQKSTGESENAGKHYMKWFTAAGLFALAWGLMGTLFTV